nr:reverse transcriptase domain-containing protein [Tanacetum cinerariifolium]
RQAANKRKFKDTSRNNQSRQQPPKRQDVSRAYAAGSGNRKQYARSRPLCPKCNFNHDGPCIPRCYKCNKIGHLAHDCRSSTNADVANNQRGNGADHDYAVELADGRIVDVNTVIRSCTLNFLNHPFNIDLMSVEMGSFDVIIGMDWLSRYQAVIICADKIVRIPWVCPKCNFNHDGPCTPRCYKCNKIGHLSHDCRSPTSANVANNQRGNRAGQKVTCYECGAQEHFKRYCPKLKNNNNNRSNQVGTGNAQAGCMPWAMQGQTRMRTPWIRLFASPGEEKL